MTGPVDPSPPGDRPCLTVVIPCFNEKQVIQLTCETVIDTL